ncbi:hypothetical protein V1605_16245 [Enterobacter soli]|jgi:hypothetical protein|nr:hypothetical protein [Enterobacter soli]MDD9244910.1 hypothetical protein [Enterobacter soli]
MGKPIRGIKSMGFQFWLMVVVAFLTGPFAFISSIIYMRRGIYTKSFKGTRRKEYIHKDDKPIEYWSSVISRMIAGVAMVGLGFWFLNDIPVVNHWFAEIREIILVKTRQ